MSQFLYTSEAAAGYLGFGSGRSVTRAGEKHKIYPIRINRTLFWKLPDLERLGVLLKKSGRPRK